MIIFLAHLFLVSEVSWAHDACLTALKAFERENACYNGSKCFDNIYHFVKNLAINHPEISLKKSKVLYIFSSREKLDHTLVGQWLGWNVNRYMPHSTSFRAINSREGTKVTWMFHVVLLYDSLIYDFDFGPEPKPIDIETYAHQMLDIHWDKTDFQSSYKESLQMKYDLIPVRRGLSMTVKEIPALSYLEYHWPDAEQGQRPEAGAPTRKVPTDWLDPNDEIPMMPMRDFIKSYLKL